MSLPKAQLVDPQGNMNLPGMTATGIVTASSLKGVTTGSATGLTGNPDLDVGIVTASSFVGQGDGHAANLTGTPQLNLGVTTATSFVGDAVGKAAGLTGTPNLNVGLITATSFVGFVTGDIIGDVSGDVTGTVTGDVSGDVEGNVTGNVSGLAGALGINGINAWAGAGTSNLEVGVCTATLLYGDGSALTGAGSSAYIAQEVTASPNVSSETIIDLSYGNLIYFNQTTKSTTVGFASTSPAEQLTLIRNTSAVTPSFATGAVEFDAAEANYLSLAATADFNLGTGDYTIECWINSDDNTNASAIWTQYDYYSMMLYQKNDGNLAVYGIIGVGNHGYILETGAGFVQEGRWYHVAVVRVGTTAYLYVDGELKDSTTQSATLPTPSANSPFYIGISYGDSTLSNAFDGKISNLRVIKGTALYTSNFNPPFYELTNVTNTKLLCCQSTSDVTAKAVGGTITETGSLSASAQTITSSSSVTPSITWPSTVTWNNGTTPTLINSGAPGAFQILHLTTADTGASYRAWEEMQDNPAIYQLWSWGYNNSGNLGVNDRTQRSSPTQVGTDQAWVYIAYDTTGDGLSAGIKNDSTLWTWGFNSDGSLGQNTSTTKISSPVQIPGTWSNFVETGKQKVIATKTNGTLWMWGENYYGTLGQNQGGEDNENRSSPTQIPGTTWSTKVQGVSTGTANVYGIKTDGSLWAWGMNEYGQLGQGNKTHQSSPVQVGSDETWSTINGNNHWAAAIKTDGTLWTWGLNQDGALAHNNGGTGPTLGRLSSPKQVGTENTWHKIIGNTATKTDGTLWSWGMNFHGTVENSRTSRSSPVQIAGTTWDKDNFCEFGSLSALKTDGTLWTWGRNYAGALAHNSPQPSERSSPTQVGTDTNWKAVGNAGYTIFALRG